MVSNGHSAKNLLLTVSGSKKTKRYKKRLVEHRRCRNQCPAPVEPIGRPFGVVQRPKLVFPSAKMLMIPRVNFSDTQNDFDTIKQTKLRMINRLECGVPLWASLVLQERALADENRSHDFLNQTGYASVGGFFLGHVGGMIHQPHLLVYIDFKSCSADWTSLTSAADLGRNWVAHWSGSGSTGSCCRLGPGRVLVTWHVFLYVWTLEN